MSTTAQYVPGAPQTAPEAPMRGLLQRAADVVFSPGRVMAELARAESPPWAGPAFLAAVVMSGLTLLTLVLIPADEIARFFFEAATQAGTTRGATLEQMRPMVPIQLGGFAFMAAVWAFVRPFLVGVVLLVLFNSIAGGDGRFAQYRSVVSHAALVSLLGFVVQWALRVFSGKLDLSLDLSLLAPGLDERSLPFALLRTLNIFLLWAFVVLGVGVSAVNRKRWTGATAAVLTLLTLAFAVAGFLVTRAFTGGAGS